MNFDGGWKVSIVSPDRRRTIAVTHEQIAGPFDQPEAWLEAAIAGFPIPAVVGRLAADAVLLPKQVRELVMTAGARWNPPEKPIRFYDPSIKIPKRPDVRIDWTVDDRQIAFAAIRKLGMYADFGCDQLYVDPTMKPCDFALLRIESDDWSPAVSGGGAASGVGSGWKIDAKPSSSVGPHVQIWAYGDRIPEVRHQSLLRRYQTTSKSWVLPSLGNAIG